MADLGGGRGALPPYLALSGHKVVVYDINFLWDHGGDPTIQDRFRKWGTEHGLNAEFGSIFNIPEDDEQFDVVTCVSVIEHIKHKHHALREAMRILKKGGVFVMTFDFTRDDENLSDEKRVEIFTPSLLRETLAEIGTEFEPYTPGQIDISISDIQRDRVLGIPKGMTVGGVALVKS